MLTFQLIPAGWVKGNMMMLTTAKKSHLVEWRPFVLVS
jgi:hypothetical protein